MMDIREKLVELILECDRAFNVLAHYKSTKSNILADHLIANNVTVQESREQACRSCRGAVQTDELFEVTNPHGVKVYVQFNYCPVCGRKLH